MSGIDKLRDLLALITTSQFAYQVFQGSQTTILAAVIRNAMPDGNIYIAIAACKAIQVSKLGWAEVSYAAVARAQDDFLKENPCSSAPETCSLRDRTLLVSLFKLWWTVFAYQVFQGSQTTILAAVIRNAMPDGNIYIAIAACKAIQVSKLGWAEVSYAAVARAQDDFLKENPCSSAPETCSLRDRTLLVSLFKLWWTVDYFLYRFEQVALEFAARKLPMLQCQRDRNITRDESSRLQRAFLRFEVYRRVTPLHLQPDLEEFPADELYSQTTAFLKCFSPWEREEILSVQEFLVEFAKDIVRDSQDHIIRVIASVARGMTPRCAAFQDPSDLLSICELQGELEKSGLDIFMYEESYRGRRRFQFFVGRGLRFLRSLSHLPSNHKIEAIVEHSFSCCRPTLLDLLVEDHDEITLYDAEVGWRVKEQIGCLRHPNPGWLWAEAHHLTTSVDSMLKRYYLRRMGYVFWDEARLRMDWRLPDTSPSMIELIPRMNRDDDEHWQSAATLRERFGSIRVPRGAFFRRFDKLDAFSRLQPDDSWDERLYHVYRMSRPFSLAEAKLFGLEY
nr:hypothetical protein CFP56_36212 [Quercus suber]